MSEHHNEKSQGNEFAKAYTAAKALIGKPSGVKDEGSKLDPIVKLESYEAEETFRPGSPSSTTDSSFGGPADHGPVAAEANETIAEDDELPFVVGPTEDPKDDDYIPSAEEDGTPKPFNAMKLKSATKRKDRPFAPPERHPKKQPTTSSVGELVESRSTQHPAKWYSKKGKGHYRRSELQDLKYLSLLVTKCQQEVKSNGTDLPNLFEQLRDRLTAIGTYDNVNHILVQDSKLLQEGGALQSIFGKAGVDFPHDLCADAMTQFLKWSRGDYDPDLLRGIEYKHHTKSNKTVLKSYNLEADYGFKNSAAYIGEGTLTNGQWWPLQICLVRDGAHGELEAGISGERGGVAYSVILSNSGYANIDNGGQVEYCGTSGHDKVPTAHTKMLLESLRRKAPVRLIRSSATKPIAYLPKKGLRYDGLYNVSSFVILNKDTAMHRFVLDRQPDQGAIRHTGVGARPSEQELEIYGRLRKNLGLPA